MSAQNVTIILGCMLIIAGVAFVYWPAGIVVAGILAIAAAFTSEW